VGFREGQIRAVTEDLPDNLPKFPGIPVTAVVVDVDTNVVVGWSWLAVCLVEDGAVAAGSPVLVA